MSNVECRRMESLRSVFYNIDRSTQKLTTSRIHYSMLDVRCSMFISFLFDYTGRFSGRRKRFSLGFGYCNSRFICNLVLEFCHFRFIRARRYCGIIKYGFPPNRLDCLHLAPLPSGAVGGGVYIFIAGSLESDYF